MWKIIITFVSILFISHAQDPNGDCYLEGVEPTHWQIRFRNDPVDDSETNEFRRFKAENILSVDVRGEEYGKYIHAELIDDELVITPKDAFKDYETEQESVAGPEMYVQLAFKCANTNSKNLAFYQPINDINTYPPEFQESSYTYQLPMPLPANFDISVFGKPIEACDTDISNIRLDFSITPDEDFTISWVGSISGTKNKCHRAVVTTKSHLRLTADKDYTIKVTDIGTPTKSTTADFKIEVDEQTSLPPNPQFDAAYYTATYNLEEEHSITIPNDINLKEGCSKVNLALLGDHADNFEKTCEAEKVIIKLKTQLSEEVLEENSIVLITIEATLENAEEPGRSVLVVYLPKQECPEVTTIPPTACPSTVTPTECPVCPTELTTSFTCSPCNTECPSTPAECTPCPTTECPPSSTSPGECPSTPTECPLSCPPCSPIPGECPSTPPSTDCPICQSTPSIPTECPLTCTPCSSTPGECPSTECPVTCPGPELTTECPICATTPSECPSTECPVTCPGPELSTECPVCPTTPGECPSTECPVTCPGPEVTTECPICPTTPGECPSTECPVTSPGPELTTECPICPTTPGECPSTECPVTCPGPEFTTECPICPTTPSECPSTECPVTCPGPELTTECPICATTPEPSPPETIIKFEQDNYRYKIKSWNAGNIIGIVKAIVTPKEEIEYSIEPNTGFLECNKETGELTMTTDEVNPGTYTFKAYAVGVETKSQAQTIVLTEIIEDDEDAEPNTEYSVLVKYVDEDQDEEAEITLPCHFTYCKYEVGETYPKIEDGILRMENNILYVSKIQREREDIIKMLVPQFSIRFYLPDVGSPLQQKYIGSKNNSVVQSNLNTKEELKEWVYIPKNIPNLPNQLFMSIIINDVNNNKPLFKVGSELVVGYPTADLALQLTPPYLAKVEAIDLDSGINAKIKYSTESKYFTVHPETGVIYPGEDVFDDDSNLKFIVTAKDRNGADDGLSTDLEIEVKPLKQENLIVLIVKNLMLEDIDETMEKLTEESEMKISYLTAAVIPLDNTKDSRFDQPNNFLRNLKGIFKSMIAPKANVDHSSRIIVYGLDNDNEPIETDDLEEVLEDTGVLEDFTTDKWVPGSPSGEGNNGGEESSTTGYIVAISVLASLLVIFMIAAAVFYYFKIYKVKKLEPYDTMEEEDTHSVNFEKNPRTSSVSKYEEPIPQRRVTGFVFNPPPIEEDEDEFGEKTYEDTSDYGPGKSWTKNEPEEYMENKPKFLDTPEQYVENKAKLVDTPPEYVTPGDNLYGGENSVKYEEIADLDGERRKSVKFKETVEKINILVDDRQDDDVIDERL